MASDPTLSRPLRLSDLSGSERTFDLRPEGAELDALRAELDVLDLRKLRFRGALAPDGAQGWRLDATLGATVVQPCRVTLAPVTTRIDEPVTRRYLADLPAPAPGEVEMPEDETVEPLPDAVILRDVLIEALALALPPFPRADDADAGAQVFTEPGKAAMTDEDARPFAGLAALRDGLKKDRD